VKVKTMTDLKNRQARHCPAGVAARRQASAQAKAAKQASQ